MWVKIKTFREICPDDMPRLTAGTMTVNTMKAKFSIFSKIL